MKNNGVNDFRKDLRTVLVYLFTYLVVETMFLLKNAFEMITLRYWGLFFQIPEARTQAIFTDCQLHIWAVEGNNTSLTCHGF